MNVNVLWLFLTRSWVGRQCVIVVFPDHTHLLFVGISINPKKPIKLSLLLSNGVDSPYFEAERAFFKNNVTYLRNTIHLKNRFRFINQPNRNYTCIVFR